MKKLIIHYKYCEPQDIQCATCFKHPPYRGKVGNRLQNLAYFHFSLLLFHDSDCFSLTIIQLRTTLRTWMLMFFAISLDFCRRTRMIRHIYRRKLMRSMLNIICLRNTETVKHNWSQVIPKIEEKIKIFQKVAQCSSTSEQTRLFLLQFSRRNKRTVSERKVWSAVIRTGIYFKITIVTKFHSSTSNRINLFTAPRRLCELPILQ